MALTLREVKGLVENFGEDNDRYGNGGRSQLAEELEYLGKGKSIASGEHEIFYVDGDFGGEGQGENIWYIFRIKGQDELYKVDGYYSSYEGRDWEEGDIREVKAVEYTAVRYENI